MNLLVGSTAVEHNGFHNYVCSQRGDDLILLGAERGRLPILKLSAREVSSFRRNQQPRVRNQGEPSTWMTLAVVSPGECWTLPNLFAQDTLRTNEYLSGFQHR